MFGNNPIRSVIKNNNNLLSIQNIFLTIQGEGPFVGMPAIFVRLGGCNLACKFCDTEFESFQDLSYEEIFTQITKLKEQNATNLVVITGGEPMRQPIEIFCQMLLEKNFVVQIETNGTIFRNLPVGVSIICSPKPHMNGYGLIRPDLLERLAAIKFIVSTSRSQYSDIAEVGQSQFNIPVYIQPMDECDTEKNAQNTSHAIALVQKYGYRLSLQIHKFIGIE